MDAEKVAAVKGDYRRRPILIATLTSVVLLGLGIYLIARGIFFAGNIMAYVGIALTFWGALLLYIRPVRYLRGDIFTETFVNHIRNINSLVIELGYKGSPRYISPRTLSGLNKAVLYIPESDQSPLPTGEQLSSDGILLEEPRGLKFAPPGLALSYLVERELNADFSLVDMEYLQYNLGRGFIDGLELVSSFNMSIEDSTVKVTVKDYIFDDAFVKLEEENMLDIFGDVIISAMACIFARSTHSPVLVENYYRDSVSKSLTVEYLIENEK